MQGTEFKLGRERAREMGEMVLNVAPALNQEMLY
jgi:hypothetical protein